MKSGWNCALFFYFLFLLLYRKRNGTSLRPQFRSVATQTGDFQSPRNCGVMRPQFRIVMPNMNLSLCQIQTRGYANCDYGFMPKERRLTRPTGLGLRDMEMLQLIWLHYELICMLVMLVGLACIAWSVSHALYCVCLLEIWEYDL